MVAAILQEQGVRLEVGTLAIEGSLDSYYARRVAEVLEAPLAESPWDPVYTPTVNGHGSRAVLTAAAQPWPRGRVFTGDGGGETFGFLLMPASVMSLMARGETEAAIRDYLGGHLMPSRLFRQPWSNILKERPPLAMRRALERMAHLPPQKALHFFVVLNDLRRHLHDTFDACPRHGIDFVTPFYDYRVLRSVLSLAPPLEPFLEHRLYHEIVRLLAAPCFQIPWQSYPGHLPCPVKDEGAGGSTEGLMTQWDLLKKRKRPRGEFLRRRAFEALRSGRAPRHLFQMPMLLAAIAAHKLRLADRAYWFSPVDALAECIYPGSRILPRDEQEQ
jgi:hypothetical protein